ncbi:MAG: hypothetical protein M0Q29_00300 [Thiopseudomonas sp.]|nr:hypothetical protein [Thiopseudomonas sp.]MCK9464307.1 hypothetical protein [Thiopseudomonas sp.]
MQTSFELYRALVSINVTEDRAKAVVVALEADMTNHLATKTDIMVLKADIMELKADINELRTATKADIKELRNELKADIGELRGALREQGLRLTIQLGLMVSGIMGIGLAAARLMFTS